MDSDEVLANNSLDSFDEPKKWYGDHFKGDPETD